MIMHPDQLAVAIETVRELVSNQFPGRATLPITQVASQVTVNALFRIGDQLVVRFPLRPAMSLRPGAGWNQTWLHLEWQRGKAWAFEQAMGVVWYYVRTNLAMSHMGRRTLDRIRRQRQPQTVSSRYA